MATRRRLTFALVVLLAPLAIASSASAQAGAACDSVTQGVCGLGGQIRGQIGDGLPLPISIAPAGGGSGVSATGGVWLSEPHYSHIKITPAYHLPTTQTTMGVQGLGHPDFGGLPFVGKGLGQQGQIKPTPSATIVQSTPPFPSSPRALSLRGGATPLGPGLFHYGGQPQGSIGVVNFNDAVFAVQTKLTYDSPHPGFTKSGVVAAVTQEGGGPVPTGTVANKFFAGGRRGAATVTFYADATATGNPTTNYGHGVPPTSIQTAMAGNAAVPPINGIARFTATNNQFGGQSIGRAIGTARVYFNGVPMDPATQLPCKITATPLEGTTAQGTFVPFVTGGPCQFSLSLVDLTGSNATVGVAGGRFNGLGIGSAFTTNTGVFTGTIGFNGTIIGQGAAVTIIGAGIPFTGQGAQSVGLPLTTGRLSVTVTQVQGFTSEMFIRTGIDARDAAGNGVVSLVSGSMTARDISGGNANRTWITMEIPEPSAIFAASAGFFALFGCHRLARRRA